MYRRVEIDEDKRRYIAEASERPLVKRSHEIFKKDKEEKDLIRVLKHTNKSARKLVYGANYRRHFNVPKQRELVEAKLVLVN